jgi:hypothetical protein
VWARLPEPGCRGGAQQFGQDGYWLVAGTQGLAQFAGQAQELGLQRGLLGAVFDQGPLGVEEIFLGDGQVVEAAPAGFEMQFVGGGDPLGCDHPAFRQGAISRASPSCR